MTQTSLKEQIKKLVELQKIDSEIYSIKNDLVEKPQKIDSLKIEFEQQKERFNQLEEQLKKLQLERKEKELELQSKEDEIGKANSQLLQIKTNKEYTAKINEIESIKADKSQIEEQVLVNYDAADKVKEEVNQEKLLVDEKEKVFLENKKIIEGEIKDLESKVTQLEGQRILITPDINPNYLNTYERLLENRNGSAIVAVYSGSCGGCYMNLAPQVINQLKMGEEIVVCESCSRLLYLEDEL